MTIHMKSTWLTLTTFLIHLISVESINNSLKVAPKDQIFYYGKGEQKVLQVCVSQDVENKVEWRRANQTLISDNRISIFNSKNIEKYIKEPTRIDRVNVLEIKPVRPEDQGEYSCVDLKTQKETKFRIAFTVSCKRPFFKCQSDDATCIKNSSVCDGVQDCDDFSDESLESGCKIPSEPQNLRVTAKSWGKVKLNWDGVKDAIFYEIRNNENESVIIPSDKNEMIFEGLRSGVKYQFSIRARSYTGKSVFSGPVEVETNLYERLGIPQYVDGLDFEGIGILVSWMPVNNAELYQVLIVYPDGSNNTVEVKITDFTLKEVKPNSIYSFRVRQWSGFEYGEFSKKTYVKSRPVKESALILYNLTMSKNESLSIFWEEYSVKLPTKGEYRVNTRFHEMTYMIDTCQLEPVYIEYTTNETLISDVHVLDWINKSDNTLHKRVTWVNYTIHYDKKHRKLLYYRNVSCKTTEYDSDTNNLLFKIDGMKVDYNYSFRVLVYFNDRVVGELAEGNFTAPEVHVPKQPEHVNIFHGVVSYGIACGILIVILFASFFIAWACKWDKLMADLQMKKARLNNEQEQAKLDKVRPQLLTGSYITDRTQCPMPNENTEQNTEQSKLKFAEGW